MNPARQRREPSGTRRKTGRKRLPGTGAGSRGTVPRSARRRDVPGTTCHHPGDHGIRFVAARRAPRVRRAGRSPLGLEVVCDCRAVIARVSDGGDRPADAPARHRVRLRDSIHDDEAIAVGGDLQQRWCRMLVGDSTVDLVGNHPPPAPFREGNDSPEPFGAIHGARGIARRVEDQTARSRSRRRVRDRRRRP